MAVELAFGFDQLDGFVHAGIRLCAGGAKVIERAENVVVVARWEGEFEKFGIGDFAGGAASEERTFEQIFFGTVAGGGNFGCVRVVSLLRQFRYDLADNRLMARSYSSSPSKTQIVV